MFDPKFLDNVVSAVVVCYRVNFYRDSNNVEDYQATINAARNRLGGIYVKRREALVDLAARMEKHAVHYTRP